VDTPPFPLNTTFNYNPLTGHKTYEMFLRYSHLDKEQGEGAMEKLNGLLSQKSGSAQLAGSK
jgi:hypothetical protein